MPKSVINSLLNLITKSIVDTLVLSCEFYCTNAMRVIISYQFQGLPDWENKGDDKTGGSQGGYDYLDGCDQNGGYIVPGIGWGSQ